MTRAHLYQGLREVRAAVLFVAVPFTIGYLISFPFALRAALRHYQET